MPWEPAAPPLLSDENANELGRWALQQMQQLAAALENPDITHYNVLHVEPEKPREGQVVVADGTDWDPGDGAGQYMYIGGAWVIQRAGPEPNTYGIMTDGTTPAPAEVSGDTFKFRGANGVKVTVQNDDVTHGDNALHELDINAITQAAPALGDKSPFADVSNSNAIRQDTYQKILDLIGALTTEAAPDFAADFLGLYDVSGAVAKKVSLSKFGQPKTLISTTSLVGVTGQTISIPSGYQDIEVIIRGMLAGSGLGQIFGLRFSEDGGSSFINQYWVENGVAGPSNDSTIQLHPNINNANSISAYVKVTNYIDALSKAIRGHIYLHTAASIYDLMAFTTNTAAAINAVRVQTSGVANLAAGSVELWGIK